MHCRYKYFPLHKLIPNISLSENSLQVKYLPTPPSNISLSTPKLVHLLIHKIYKSFYPCIKLNFVTTADQRGTREAIRPLCGFGEDFLSCLPPC